MKRTYFIYFFILSILSVLCFQNCGNFNSTGSNQSPSNISSADFKAGDTFKPELVPYNVSPELANALANYSQLNGFKAVVLTKEGNGLAYSLPDAVSQADASQALLERCQVQFKQLCALFAEGNFIKYDAKDFSTKHLSVIFNVTTFDAMRIPGPVFKWKEHTMRTYPGTTTTYHAIALGIRGALYQGWSNVSQIDASRRALEFCEAPTDHPCTLYAEEFNVLFDIDNFQWTQRLVDFGPKTLDINRIPFISDDQRTRIAVPMYQRMVNNNNRSVVAISRYGHWYHRESTQNITQADRDFVLQECNKLIPPNPDPAQYQYRCFIYSENMQVVMTRAIYDQYSLGK